MLKEATRMYIVTGIFGMGTDITTACIDPTDIELIPEEQYLATPLDRGILIKAFDPTENLLEKIEIASKKYKSLESWINQRSIERDLKTKNHTYIFVDVSSEKAVNWIKTRFEMHTGIPESFNERIVRNTSIVSKHYADHTIALDDILDGKLIEILSKFVDTPLDEKLYKSWLTLVKYDIPWE